MRESVEAKRARQAAWIAHWTAGHTKTVDAAGIATFTPKPGWDWAREGARFGVSFG